MITLRQSGDSRLPETLNRFELPAPIQSRLDQDLPANGEYPRADDEFTRRLGFNSSAAFVVPVRSSERPLGFLVAEHRRRILNSEPEADFLSHLAERAASAISNARLVQNAQQSAITLHSLLEMSETVTSSLRIRDILGVLDDFCRRLVGVRACRLWVAPDLADGSLSAARASGGGADSRHREAQDEEREERAGDLIPLGGRVTPIERAAARKVLETGAELFLNSPEAVDELLTGVGGEQRADPRIRNLMAWPLRTETEVVGVLLAIDKPEPFNQRDHSLLAGLVSQATIALVNARLYEGLEERAARISRLVETLAAEKDKLEHVLGNMEAGVLLLDREGLVGLANHSGRRLLAPRGRVSLPAAPECFEDPLELLPRLASAEASQKPIRETLPHGERYFELSATRLTGGNGTIAVLRDITELVRMNAMRSDFVSHVSHELRTPLAAIVGSIKLILEGRVGDLSGTQGRLLGVVERESNRLMHMINDLLDLARLEAGQMVINRDRTDLGVIVAEAVESLHPLALSKSIELEASHDDLTHPVPCDPTLIRQVLHNLIGNAIKFTPEGGAVRVEAETGEEMAEVRVVDTGVGIPRHKWEAVFNKFEQVSVNQGPVKGSGLGLAICQQIVERHGGRIAVVSEEGAGSTFRFTLPLVEPRVEAEMIRAA
jgi:signal transduction histidine kinase